MQSVILSGGILKKLMCSKLNNLRIRKKVVFSWSKYTRKEGKNYGARRYLSN